MRMIPAVTSPLKIMADLDIAERRLPQDGRIRKVLKGRAVGFRVSTLLSCFGEKCGDASSRQQRNPAGAESSSPTSEP